jgi:hypothetical protein
MRTAGSGEVGQSGSEKPRHTRPGANSAAGALVSKGNAPNTIGAAPDRRPTLAAVTSA